MANTIRITGRMADALINTAVSEDERTVRLSLNVLVGTVVALMDRGFVEYNREMSRENGYPTHTFTPLGVAAQEQLVKESWGPNPKTFSREKLMAAAAKTSQPAPVAPEVTEYSVKIWYRSGAYEGAPHCPEDLARKIYAEAAASAGVEFAELHGPSGKLVESKTPERCPVAAYHRCELSAGHVGRHQNGRTTWLGELDPNAPAGNPFLPPLNVSQHGEDLTAAYSAQDPAEPTA